MGGETTRVYEEETGHTLEAVTLQNVTEETRPWLVHMRQLCLSPTLTGHVCACRLNPRSAWLQTRCSGGMRLTAPWTDLIRGMEKTEVRTLSHA